MPLTICSDEYYLRLDLQFFANDEGGEKTEEATPKKLDDARKEGQVAKSQELNTAFELIMLFVILKIFVGSISNRFVDGFKLYYGSIESYSEGLFTMNYFAAYLRSAMGQILVTLVPVLAASVFMAVAVNVFQVGWKPTAKPMEPKFDKLNPVNGFKRIFKLDKLVDLLKAVLKVGLVAYIAYTTFRDRVGLISLVYDLNLFSAVMLIGNEVINFGLKVSAVFLVVGVADYIYQKFKFAKEMRMSKQEIKDEFKQTEGDPKIKGQIRQKMREASQRRMMQKLPEADVVITNPTHLACAIKYDKEIAEAPVLIAKGADYLAEKIKETAREHFIPIVENKPLARMLYHNVEIDEEIPQELYQMTAEVLSYVYSISGKM
ncbi:MAG: flagellar biosynthesis protein FlhB [Lachnospiraceae bacterium]|nr:flagellar biosynthesis protein FlhB [Lachnospiraceae bacterium]